MVLRLAACTLLFGPALALQPVPLYLCSGRDRPGRPTLLSLIWTHAPRRHEVPPAWWIYGMCLFRKVRLHRSSWLC